MPWATHTLQWVVQWVARERSGANPQSHPQFRLQAETRLHEGGVASNRRSAYCGEYVLGDCTHRPSRHESWQRLKSMGQPQLAGEAVAEGGADDWDEVVTR
jgi:hypothetical protein